MRQRRSIQRRSRISNRRAVILLIVLVVVVMLSLAGYAFTHLMLTHEKAARLSGRQVQSRVLVDSGVEAVRMYFIQDEATRLELGGHFDNPDYFQAVPVVYDDDALYRGNFTVLAPNLDEEGYLSGQRYGLEDLSTRLNLNSLMLAEKSQEGSGRTLLMALPGMTEEIADAILDWLDEDDEPREFGAEVESYPTYAPRNGPMETVEELLLVLGVTPELLFGMDTNRNGVIDPAELNQSMQGLTSTGTSGTTAGTSGDGTDLQTVAERGWVGHLTLHSQEKNANAIGNPRIFLNNDDLEELYNELLSVFNEEWAVFVVAYRQSGPYDGNEDGESGAGKKLDFSKPGKTKLTQVLDLIGKKVQATFEGQDQPTVLSSPFPEDLGAMNLYLPVLIDNATVNDSPTIPGRVNINEAPTTILLGIPGMTEEIVAQILEQRSAESESGEKNPALQFETWILTGGIVSLDEMKTLSPFINAGGDVFQSQVVGYFEGGGSSSRSEVIFDATGSLPRVLFWRDISHLGRGYSLETLGVQLIDDF